MNKIHFSKLTFFHLFNTFVPEQGRQVFGCCRCLCRQQGTAISTDPGLSHLQSLPCLGLSGNPELSSAMRWDSGASRCAELPAPLEGVELRRILCFHKGGKWKTGSLSVISEAMGGLHPSGHPCSAPWQQPRLLVHYTTAAGWEHSMGCPCSQESSWSLQERQLCSRLDQVVPSSGMRFPGGVTCTFHVPSISAWGAKCI